MIIPNDILAKLSHDDAAEIQQLRIKLDEQLNNYISLSEKSYRGPTLTEVGKSLGIGRERARQIEKLALMKLKRRIKTDSLMIDIAEQLGISPLQ